MAEIDVDKILEKYDLVRLSGDPTTPLGAGCDSLIDFHRDYPEYPLQGSIDQCLVIKSDIENALKDIGCTKNEEVAAVMDMISETAKVRGHSEFIALRQPPTNC